MKAALFALVVLLGFDVVVYHGEHARNFWAAMASTGHSIGAWVYY